MAVARVICTCKRCGKTFERRTRRWTDQKAREWEEWAAEHITLCRACEYDYYVAGAAKLAQAASAKGLPELQGSEKQITWAEYIRVELLNDAEKFLKDNWDKTRMIVDDEIKEHNEMVLHTLGQVLVQVRLETSAKWWINNRGRDGGQLLRSVYREQHPEELEK